MDQQAFVSSPIYRSKMLSESHSPAHQVLLHDDERDAKASSTRSPTTVFAIDELSSVFRVPDEATERGSPYLDFDTLRKESGSNPIISSRRRCLTPSFTTDVELSTFSEDTEEDEDDEVATAARLQSAFTVRRRQSPLSIFRPVGGTKRRCDFDDDNDEEEHINTTPTKRRAFRTPSLCRANAISSDNEGEENLPLFSSSSSFESPFKRVCKSSDEFSFLAPSTSSTSPYSSFFTEATSQPSIKNTPQLLQHPISFDTLPSNEIFKFGSAKEVTINKEN